MTKDELTREQFETELKKQIEKVSEMVAYQSNLEVWDGGIKVFSDREGAEVPLRTFLIRANFTPDVPIQVRADIDLDDLLNSLDIGVYYTMAIMDACKSLKVVRDLYDHEIKNMEISECEDPTHKEIHSVDYEIELRIA